MYLTPDQLKQMGFGAIGENVLISDKASIYNPGNISICSNVRIDDFVILSAGSGGIFIGNYCHISCYVSMIGQGRITMRDYSALSGGVRVYSSSDNYTGNNLIGVTVPEHLRDVIIGDVIFNENAVVGAGSVVMPNVGVGINSRVGALSFVNKYVPPNEIWGGNPCKFLKSRSAK